MEIQTLPEAAHTGVRATVTAPRALIEALGTLLMVQEVVDGNVLTRLRETAVSEEVPDAPVASDLAEDTVGTIKLLVTSSYNGEHIQARESRESEYPRRYRMRQWLQISRKIR